MNAPPRSAWSRAFEAWRRRPGEQLSLEDARPAAGDELRLEYGDDAPNEAWEALETQGKREEK